MESGSIPDSSLSASSYLITRTSPESEPIHLAPHKARLGNGSGEYTFWASSYRYNSEVTWIQVSFEEDIKVLTGLYN